MFNGIEQGSLASYPGAFGEKNCTVKEIKFEDYLKINPRSEVFVRALAQATVPVYNRGRYLHGNGVAIGKDLVLVSRHCVDEENVNLGYAGTGKIIFDGTVGREKLDFAILWVKGANFSPITLDVEPGSGTSIQMYCKSISTHPFLQWYVNPFESGQSMYAERSDQATSSTSPGESGAPRMSLRNGYVHAIHQGVSEGLKVNDIYCCLQQASENRSDPRQQDAYNILKNIQVANLKMLLMSWSPLVLKQGDVFEEKGRVDDDVIVTVEVPVTGQPKKTKKIQATFHYTEIGEGKDHRQVRINMQGKANSLITYAISPHPDDNAIYRRKGNQKEFYKILTLNVGAYYLQHENQYPPKGTIKVFGENYTLIACIKV